MKRFLVRALGVALAGAGPVAPALAADGFAISAVRAHLFYERSGQLSEDIAAIGGELYNTVIGEGAAAEPASNLLVVVEMTAAPGSSTEVPLVIEVSALRDDPVSLVRRSYDFLYTDHGDARVARAVWVENATCEPLRVVATHGEERQTVDIPFLCGE